VSQFEQQRIAAGRVLSTDSAFGDTVEYMEYDESTGEFVLRRETNISPLLGYVDALKSQATNNWKGDMHLVASIPDSVVLQLYDVRKKEGSAGMQKWLKAWLNSEAAEPFRIKRGRI
jgi:hypothetical protein